jgi:hypothetical protein
MLVEWIDEPIWAGPAWQSTCLINKGDIRKVIAYNEYNKLCLSGRNSKGCLGWVEEKSIRVIEPDFINESEMVI